MYGRGAGEIGTAGESGIRGEAAKAGEAGAAHPSVAARAKPKTSRGEAGTRIDVSA